MIRSARIPALLDRICDKNNKDDDGNAMIRQALLVTADGELLGCSNPDPPAPGGNNNSNNSSSPIPISSSSFGTLIADIAVDYQRLGEEYATATAADDAASSSQRSNKSSASHLQCLLLEMDRGLVAVTACTEMDCFVVAVASPEAPRGLVKARLQALAVHVQEALLELSTHHHHLGSSGSGSGGAPEQSSATA